MLKFSRSYSGYLVHLALIIWGSFVRQYILFLNKMMLDICNLNPGAIRPTVRMSLPCNNGSHLIFVFLHWNLFAEPHIYEARDRHWWWTLRGASFAPGSHDLLERSTSDGENSCAWRAVTVRDSALRSTRGIRLNAEGARNSGYSSWKPLGLRCMRVSASGNGQGQPIHPSHA